MLTEASERKAAFEHFAEPCVRSSFHGFVWALLKSPLSLDVN
jgi:hypothetical protein